MTRRDYMKTMSMVGFGLVAGGCCMDFSTEPCITVIPMQQGNYIYYRITKGNKSFDTGPIVPPATIEQINSVIAEGRMR